MRTSHHLNAARHPIQFDQLEPRQLRSVASPAVGDGNDYHLSLAADGTVVRTASQDAWMPDTSHPFRWYDGTPGSPLAAATSAIDRGYCDSWYFWPSSGPGEVASEAGTRELARDVASWGTEIVVLDNETWRFDIRFSSRAVVDKSIADMKQVIAWIRDERPQLKVGIYGYMSQSDDNASWRWPAATNAASNGNGWYDAHLPEYSDIYADWQATSEYLRPLADSVDYMFPAIYTGTADVEGWKGTAKIAIEDSRRYGKPVIPFIWPKFHQGVGSPLAGTEVPFWQEELDLVRQYADGAFIWTDNAPDPNSAWFQATVATANQSVASGHALSSPAGALAPLLAVGTSGTASPASASATRSLFADSPLSDRDDVLERL